MKTEHIQEMQSNDVLRQRLAKYLALHCFRNTKLEDFHAGISPSSKAGDYSDVKVVSPFGEIAWNNLSRLSDSEMKILMIDVVNHCYQVLGMLFVAPIGDKLIEALMEQDVVPEWNDPQ